MSVAKQLHNIRHMPYGTARTAAAEAIARKVEADGPKEHLAEALLDLIEAYTFGGDGQKSFVVFARVLRHWDASPELFDASDEHNLFWEFKWVASDLADYPQITTAQAEALLQDMQRRFELKGSGTSAVRAARFGWAWQSGAPDADAARLEWIASPRDSFDDCHACVTGRQTDFLLEQGRDAEAFALGRTQDGRCNIEPAKTFHATALAALNLGQLADALRFHHRATASETENNRDLASSRGQSFELLARGGHLERALRELRGESRELLTDPPSPLQHLRFLLGLIAGLSANLDQSELATGVVLPGLGAAGSDVGLGDLHAWAIGQARQHVAAFDARSGTSYYADLLDRALRAERTAAPLEFGPSFAEVPPARPDGMTSGEHAGVAPETNTRAATAAGVGGRPSAPSAAPRSGLAKLWSKLTDRSAGAAGRGTAGGGTGERGGVGRGKAAPGAAHAGRISADAMLARAEESVARKDYAAAGRDYAAAIAELEGAGWLERAGLAAAEAAQCASLDRAEERAHALFGRAVPLLRAGGAGAGTLAAVLAAWAPVAARMNDAEPQILATAHALDEHPEFDGAGMTEELAARKQQEWGAERATLRDTLARSLAATHGKSFGPTLDAARAASEALLAGEEFAQVGKLADASHAFWLAGRIHREQGDTESAMWGLESAFEGFTVARQRKERLLVAGELITLLRETGQAEKADAVVAGL